MSPARCGVFAKTAARPRTSWRRRCCRWRTTTFSVTSSPPPTARPAWSPRRAKRPAGRLRSIPRVCPKPGARHALVGLCCHAAPSAPHPAARRPRLDHAISLFFVDPGAVVRVRLSFFRAGTGFPQPEVQVASTFSVVRSPCALRVRGHSAGTGAPGGGAGASRRRKRHPRRRRRRCATSSTSCGKSSSPCATPTARGSRRSRRNSRRWVRRQLPAPPAQARRPRRQRPAAAPPDVQVADRSRRAPVGGQGGPTGSLPVYSNASAMSKIFNPDMAVIGNFVGAGGKNSVNPTPGARAGGSRGDVPGGRRSLRARGLLPLVLAGGRRDRGGLPDADVASGRPAGQGRQAQGAGRQGQHAARACAAVGRQAADGAEPLRRRGGHCRMPASRSRS